MSQRLIVFHRKTCTYHHRGLEIKHLLKMKPMKSLEGFGSSVLKGQFSGVEDYSSLIRTTFATSKDEMILTRKN